MNNVLTNVKLVLLNRFEKILFLKFLVESDKMASSGPYLNPARNIGSFSETNFNLKPSCKNLVCAL